MGELITDRAVLRATGKSWDQWFTELDTASIGADGEAAVHSWFTETHTEIGGWWCQVITRRWEAQRKEALTDHS